MKSIKSYKIASVENQVGTRNTTTTNSKCFFSKIGRNKSGTHSLFHYIKGKNWNKVREMLSDTSRKKDIAKAAKKSDILGQTILHLLCRSHPPLDIVKSLVEQYSHLSLQEDYFNRSPLHHAVGWGASPQVINYLLNVNEEASLRTDTHGKTPLHMAFGQSEDGLCDTGGDEENILQEPQFSVIQSLCHAAPATINSEDNDGFSPLEYAIDFEASIEVIRMLQKKSIKDWERRKKE